MLSTWSWQQLRLIPISLFENCKRLVSRKSKLKRLLMPFRDAQAETETATRHDLKELELTLKAEMQAMEYRMTIKLGGMMAASVAIVAALVKLL